MSWDLLSLRLSNKPTLYLTTKTIFKMKKTLLFIVLFGTLLSCKKSSTNTDTNSGNYLTLNADTRQLGTIPSSAITMTNAAYSSPDEWQLSLGIKTACYKIAGLNNDEFEVYIDIWDKNLLQTEYTIVPNTGSGTPGKASLGMRPFRIGGSGLTWFDGLSGKIVITKDATGKLKSVEFNSIPLSQYNSNSYTTSGKFVLSQ